MLQISATERPAIKQCLQAARDEADLRLKILTSSLPSLPREKTS
jgi:hypothetical protein